MKQTIPNSVRFRGLFFKFVFFMFFVPVWFVSCASQRDAWETIRAEEFFNIGMAYFELGRFADAEIWLNRARVADRTMLASEFNLGRIAFETNRFGDAARYFENILARDPDNVMALQAAAFMFIRSGDFERADALYRRVLELIPESADDGFNHALVLFGMERFEESEEVLRRYPQALEENPSAILLLARAQKAQNRVEAIDSYAHWLSIHTGPANPRGLFEFAQVLGNAGHYARALEQYDAAMEALTQDTPTLTTAMLKFGRASILLAVDPENIEGIDEFSLAISQGFSDTDAIAALLDDTRITSGNRDEIRRVLNNLLISDWEASQEEEDDDEEAEDEEEENEDEEEEEVLW